MPHRILEQSGLFDFSGARPVVEERLESIVQAKLLKGDSDRYFDLLMLTAGEAALAAPGDLPMSLRTEIPPVIVDASAAHFAVLKSNSSPTSPHFPARRKDVRLWDVMLFAGDMSKVARASGESLDVILERGGFAAVVEQLRIDYKAAGNPIATAIADGAVLDLLGLVWHAKASILTDPEGADDSVQAYIEHALRIERA